MRVFSQINNCQQRKKANKQTNKQKKQKKGGAPLLGLGEFIYYPIIK